MTTDNDFDLLGADSHIYDGKYRCSCAEYLKACRFGLSLFSSGGVLLLIPPYYMDLG